MFLTCDGHASNIGRYLWFTWFMFNLKFYYQHHWVVKRLVSSFTILLCHPDGGRVTYCCCSILFLFLIIPLFFLSRLLLGPMVMSRCAIGGWHFQDGCRCHGNRKNVKNRKVSQIEWNFMPMFLACEDLPSIFGIFKMAAVVMETVQMLKFQKCFKFSKI